MMPISITFMEETYNTKAIILNRLSFREYDSRAIVYSIDKGKLELVTRGTKKIQSKLAGHIEPLNLSDIMVVCGKQFNYIGSAVNEDCYLELKNDLDKVKISGKGIKLFNELIKPEQADKELFFLLKDFLGILNKKNRLQDYNLFLHFFILKLLSALGSKPELYNCLVCKKKITPGSNSFNLNKGGLVCRKCAKTNQYLTISNNCIKILRLAVREDLGKLIILKASNRLAKETIQIIDSFYKYQQ